MQNGYRKIQSHYRQAVLDMYVFERGAGTYREVAQGYKEKRRMML
jgi:hypothetical protein